MTERLFAPSHPGEILFYEFMEPYKLSAREVARQINVPPNRITALIKGQRALTPDTALRLERLFGFSAEAWMNIQKRFDLETAKMAATSDNSILSIERYQAA